MEEDIIRNAIEKDRKATLLRLRQLKEQLFLAYSLMSSEAIQEMGKIRIEAIDEAIQMLEKEWKLS